MKRTINEIYELIKQKLEDKINAFANNGTPANRKEFEAYTEILGLIKESGLLEKEYTIDYFEHQANDFNKKYIEELDRVLAIYKRALELMAISYFGNKECIRFVNTGFQAESDVCLIEYFLDQAKEELTKEKQDARKEVL